MKEPSVPNPQEARLEASVEMGTLCAFYGGLLTDKQLQAMQLHFDEDLSLGEIARQMNVSRQNVHDLIARSSEKLRACEAALGAAGRMDRMLERRRAGYALAVYGFTGYAAALYAVFYPALTGLYTPLWYNSALLRWFPSWPL